MASSSCDDQVSTERISLSKQQDEIRVTLNHIFDVPRNGIYSAFELLLSMLEAQQVQQTDLRKEHQSLKNDWIIQRQSHQDICEKQVAHIKQGFELQIQGLRDELKSLRELYKTDSSTINETNESRLSQLEEKTDNLSIDFGILQESLLGGSTGERVSLHPLKPTQSNSDISIDFYDPKESIPDEGAPLKRDPKLTTSRLSGQSVNSSTSREESPSGVSLFILQSSHLLEDDTGHLDEPTRDVGSIHEDGDQKHDKIQTGLLSEVASLIKSQQEISEIKQPSIICNETSSSPKFLTEETCSDIASTAEENSSLSDESFQNLSDYNSSNVVERRVETVQIHNGDEKRRETIRSSALNVINTIYESVRLKGLSKEMQSNPSFASSANGVIVHLLDQEKIFERDIETLSTRIDILTESIRNTCAPVHNNQPTYIKQNSGYCESSNLDRDGDGIKDFETMLSKISADVSCKVPQTHLRFLINEMYRTLKNDNIPSDQSDEDAIHDIIHAFIHRCDEDYHKRFNQVENYLNNFRDTLWTALHSEISSRDVFINESVDNLRQSLTKFIDKSDNGIGDTSNHCNVDYSTVDEKIKLATDTMHNKISDLISSNLGQLAFIEEEVAKLTLQLVDRPDDSQINKLIQDLDQIVSVKIGKTELFESILDSMKQEMTKRMTKDEVIALVQALFNNAKDDIRNNSNSLMIGRVPYRCIGCDQLFPYGVNEKIATKINHDALTYCLAPRISLKKIRQPDLSSDSRPVKSRPRTACDSKYKIQRQSVPISRDMKNSDIAKQVLTF